MIFLRPPEKLVIEVKASGRFRNVQWFKNGLPITLTEENSANHLEIYVRDPTTADDLSLYEVNLHGASPATQRTVPTELDFSVTPPGKIFPTYFSKVIMIILPIIVDASTTANNESVAILEGLSVILSCTSVGAPVPTVTWELNNQPVQITPVVSVMQSQATLVRSDPGNSNSPFVPNIITGNIISSIEIINVSFPADDGVYTCIGSNDNQMLNISEATIALQVIGR